MSFCMFVDSVPWFPFGITLILLSYTIIYDFLGNFAVESLKWETIEQYFLWQLIAAHDIPLEHILPVLPMLEHSSGNNVPLLALY